MTSVSMLDRTRGSCERLLPILENRLSHDYGRLASDECASKISHWIDGRLRHHEHIECRADVERCMVNSSHKDVRSGRNGRRPLSGMFRRVIRRARGLLERCHPCTDASVSRAALQLIDLARQTGRTMPACRVLGWMHRTTTTNGTTIVVVRNIKPSDQSLYSECSKLICLETY
jgi:hypothetical protein